MSSKAKTLPPSTGAATMTTGADHAAPEAPHGPTQDAMLSIYESVKLKELNENRGSYLFGTPAVGGLDAPQVKGAAPAAPAAAAAAAGPGKTAAGPGKATAASAPGKVADAKHPSLGAHLGGIGAKILTDAVMAKPGAKE